MKIENFFVVETLVQLEKNVLKFLSESLKVLGLMSLGAFEL